MQTNDWGSRTKLRIQSSNLRMSHSRRKHDVICLVTPDVVGVSQISANNFQPIKKFRLVGALGQSNWREPNQGSIARKITGRSNFASPYLSLKWGSRELPPENFWILHFHRRTLVYFWRMITNFPVLFLPYPKTGVQGIISWNFLEFCIAVGEFE